MSRKPWSKKYSASRSVDTVIGPVGASSAMRVTSMHLAVFTCGRTAAPCERTCSRMRAQLRSSFSCSRRSAGVSISPRVMRSMAGSHEVAELCPGQRLSALGGVADHPRARHAPAPEGILCDASHRRYFGDPPEAAQRRLHERVPIGDLAQPGLAVARRSARALALAVLGIRMPR